MAFYVFRRVIFDVGPHGCSALRLLLVWCA